MNDNTCPRGVSLNIVPDVWESVVVTGAVLVLVVVPGVLLYRRGSRQRVVPIAPPMPPLRPKREVRRRAAKFAAISGLGLIAFVTLAIVLSFDDFKIYGPGTGLPGAIFLIFIIELVTGRDFDYWEARWGRLSPGGRFVLGVLISLMAIIFFALVMLSIVATFVL